MRTLDVTLKFHFDTFKLEVIGTTDETISFDTPYVKHYVLGTGHVVKANPRKPDTIGGSFRWIETAMRRNPSMSKKDQALIDRVEAMGGVATIRYWVE